MLAAFGGFEIAVMVGVILMAASKRHLLMIDGLPACAALMLAARIAQPVTDYCVFCRSHGHRGLDQALNLFRASALLELGMDSTDGTGATLAWPLVKCAAACSPKWPTAKTPGPRIPASLRRAGARSRCLSATRCPEAGDAQRPGVLSARSAQSGAAVRVRLGGLSAAASSTSCGRRGCTCRRRRQRRAGRLAAAAPRRRRSAARRRRGRPAAARRWRLAAGGGSFRATSAGAVAGPERGTARVHGLQHVRPSTTAPTR